jgi:hypothetical protein
VVLEEEEEEDGDEGLAPLSESRILASPRSLWPGPFPLGGKDLGVALWGTPGCPTALPIQPFSLVDISGAHQS